MMTSVTHQEEVLETANNTKVVLATNNTNTNNTMDTMTNKMVNTIPKETTVITKVDTEDMMCKKDKPTTTLTVEAMEINVDHQEAQEPQGIKEEDPEAKANCTTISRKKGWSATNPKRR